MKVEGERRPEAVVGGCQVRITEMAQVGRSRARAPARVERDRAGVGLPGRVEPRWRERLDRRRGVRARELDDEAGSAGARRRGEATSVVAGDAGGDGETATSRRAARGGERSGGSPARAGPGRASMTSMRTRPATTRPRTRTGAPPCSSAFATRLPHAWARRSGSARTSARPRSGSTESEDPNADASGRPRLGAVVEQGPDVDELGPRPRPPAPRPAATRSSSASAARRSSRSIAAAAPRRRARAAPAAPRTTGLAARGPRRRRAPIAG